MEVKISGKIGIMLSFQAQTSRNIFFGLFSDQTKFPVSKTCIAWLLINLYILSIVAWIHTVYMYVFLWLYAPEKRRRFPGVSDQSLKVSEIVTTLYFSINFYYFYFHLLLVQVNWCNLVPKSIQTRGLIIT